MARSARVTQCIGHVTTLIDAAARNRSASHHRTEKLSSIFVFGNFGGYPSWKSFLLIIDAYLGISFFHSLIIILCLIFEDFLLERCISSIIQIFLQAIYLNIVFMVYKVSLLFKFFNNWTLL